MRPLLWPLFVLSLVIGSSGAIQGGSSNSLDPRLEQVLADWQQRQTRFNAIEIQVNGKRRILKGAYSSAYAGLLANAMGITKDKLTPTEDLESQIGYTILLDLTTGRHRRTIHEQEFNLSAGTFLPLTMEDAFDGTVMKCLINKEKNPGQRIGVTQPELTIVSGNMKNGEFRSDYFPVLFALGRIYMGQHPIIPGQLREELDQNSIYIHGVSVYNDRACLVIRTHVIPTTVVPTYCEYWVDASRASSIVRFILFTGKDPTEETSIDYKQFQGYWLPYSWQRTVFAKRNRLYNDELNVVDIKGNPVIGVNEFDLGEPKPSMLVEQRVDLPTSNPMQTPKSELSVYRVREDGTHEQIPDPAHRKEDTFLSQRADFPERKLFRIGLFLLLTVVVGIIYGLVRLRLYVFRKKVTNT